MAIGLTWERTYQVIFSPACEMNLQMAAKLINILYYYKMCYGQMKPQMLIQILICNIARLCEKEVIGDRCKNIYLIDNG